jgi:hypothetical protein
MRESINIKYTLESPDMDFSVDLVFDKKDFSLLNLNDGEKDWARLAFHKCSHCPLNSEEYPFCPLARAIDSVISKIHNLLSYDEVHPGSGCPHTQYFRPMSRYHLPFADTEEKIYRATTMFLLAQYFIHKKSGCIPTDFSRLENIYSNVHIVNTQICKRLREFCENDSTLNAITILDTLTVSIHSALKHDLEKFESYFSAFSEGLVPPAT